jgi:cob(I)alamin adenosyltransferase
MRSISTTRGDGGETGLAGGIRVSKASLRVEAYGTVDELNTALGFARAICDDAEVREMSKRIQSELFTVCSVLATPVSALPYLNRLSDLLWIIARKLERDAGVSGSLREMTGKAGNRFSRAW